MRVSVAERAARVRFRRALSLMAMTLLVPGSAQLSAGNRRVGRIAVATWLVLVAVGLVTALVLAVHPTSAVSLATKPGLLLLVRLGLMVGAIAWAYLFVDAWRIGQPLTLGLGHRRAIVGVNGLLCFTVAGVMLFGAHLVAVQRDFILTTFGNGSASDAADGRYNVLLLGGDSGADRWGLRPDSMTVASIDAETGKTVLIGLPRNMANFPFRKGTVMHEQFPDGFDCDGCYLNGVSTWAGDNTELFPDSENPGVDATIMAIEGITGLEISYWAMVNMKGFKNLVDAVGGVTLNVRSRIPVGGLGSDVTGYIEPGTRKLTGFETLWYSRAREGSDDYSRMARQKCVMSAMLGEISPQVAVRNFEKIAKASSAMISTNLPASEIDTFASLAMKTRDHKMASLSLVPPLVNTAHPDAKKIRAQVRKAIDRSEGDAPKPKKPKDTAQAGQDKPTTPSGTQTPVTGGSLGSLKQGYAANQAEDLSAAC
ncbi:LCP family protein [Nocardioides sp. W7]|uniref:LCP family protein n=1 Tax=Nocardioides sp. W7 TaxID=2931390 RepID=UPI001FD1E151|nr:LCP family protein [Nocardioides sp. W7]